MRGFGRILVVAVAMLLCSCYAPQNVEMTGVDMHGWSDTATIAYSNSDTLAIRQLNISIRYNDDFREAILPLKVGITTPDARYFEEEFKLPINHPRTALTLTTNESLPYRSDVVLAQKGEYIFAFTPLTKVRGIEAIGVEFN